MLQAGSIGCRYRYLGSGRHCQIHGLENAMQGELLAFPNDVFGMVLNLEEDNVGAVLLGAGQHQ
mgnify:CR=1 FL=1